MASRDLEWQGNSKVMFDHLIEQAPPMVKLKAQELFYDWVDEEGVTTVTEDLLMQHIEKMVPAPIRNILLQQIEIVRKQFQ